MEAGWKKAGGGSKEARGGSGEAGVGWRAGGLEVELPKLSHRSIFVTQKFNLENQSDIQTHIKREIPDLKSTPPCTHFYPVSTRPFGTASSPFIRFENRKKMHTNYKPKWVTDPNPLERSQNTRKAWSTSRRPCNPLLVLLTWS
jgi:hypothetical protein